jgi:hypothetical protein
MPVSLHVWRVPRRRIPAEFLRIAREPWRLRRAPGVRFVKFRGTGAGVTFGLDDADLTRYAALIVADGPAPFTPPGPHRATIELEPLHGRGTWSGKSPFAYDNRKTDGMVAAITRARLRPARSLMFWRAIPPVAKELALAPGLLARFGMGEAPIGWQGTVSVWRSAADLTAFAYRQPEHRAVVARTPVDRWYAEELFARFAVRDITGDRSVLGWNQEGRAER